MLPSQWFDVVLAILLLIFGTVWYANNKAAPFLLIPYGFGAAFGMASYLIGEDSDAGHGFGFLTTCLLIVFWLILYREFPGSSPDRMLAKVWFMVGTAGLVLNGLNIH